MASDKTVTISKNASERERALESALSQIEKSFGKGSIWATKTR